MVENLTVTSICNSLRRGEAPAVMFLHGEEGYFTDLISKEVETLVQPDDRDFDLTVVYATDTTPAAVMEIARRYPMMSERQVVIVREIQGVKEAGMTPSKFLAALAPYVENPAPSTVLCLCFRGAKASAAEFLKALKKGGGMVFESKPLAGQALEKYISGFITSRGLNVDQKALGMLTEFVGNDLSRIDNEIGKLTVALGRGAMVTPEAVEHNIGISKDYNNYEFVSALAQRDSERVFRILDRFAADPRNNPAQVLVVNMFTLFSNLMVAHYSADRSERGLMQALGFRWPGQLKDVMAASRWCGPWQTIEIISLLREFDSASKGNGSRQDAYALMRDLCFHILNPIGMAGIRW